MKLIDNSSKTNWKFIAIVVVFAILVGGGVLWYVRLFDQQISQLETSSVTLQIPKEKKSEVDTSTWQTYRNEQFGFEVRYPRDWVNTAAEINGVFDFQFLDIKNNPNDPIGFVILVSPRGEFISGPSLVEIFNQLKRGKAGEKKEIGNRTYTKIADLIISNVPVVKYSFPIEEKLVEEILARKRNGAFVMLYPYLPGRCRDEFEQILSTFRFVDESGREEKNVVEVDLGKGKYANLGRDTYGGLISEARKKSYKEEACGRLYYATDWCEELIVVNSIKWRAVHVDYVERQKSVVGLFYENQNCAS